MTVTTPKRDIEFKIRKPVAEIPKNGMRHPYEGVFKALTSAPRNTPVIPLECKDEEAAVQLRNRLTAYFKGNAAVRLPRGGRVVFVAPASMKRGAAKKAAKRAARRNRNGAPRRR